MAEEEEDILKEVSLPLCTETATCNACELTEAQAPVVREFMQVHSISGIEDNSVLARSTCQECDFKVIVKVPAAAIKHAGERFTLQLTQESDWQDRTIMRSTTTTFSIPEIGLESANFKSDSGQMTVLEALEASRAELMNSPSVSGMSHADGLVAIMSFMDDFGQVIDGTMDATFVLEDPELKLCSIQPLEGKTVEEDEFLQAGPTSE